MYKNRNITDYIEDIKTAIGDVAEFTKGMTFETFKTDKKCSNAVIRSLEVLGEATKHIPIDFRVKHPGIPWSQMAGMRDVLIHDYMGVDLKTVWKVAVERLPDLAVKMQTIKIGLNK
jgi:uncharacterized protein with HEPN domain